MMGQAQPVDVDTVGTAGKTRRRSIALSADEAVVYDWLAANGVDEWLPQRPAFHVEGGDTPTLTYTSYLWSGERGWDAEHIARREDLGDRGDTLTELRTVPLLVAADDRVRAACRCQGLVLSGEGGNTRLSEADRRLNVVSRLLAVVSGFGGQTIVAGEPMERMVGELADEAEGLALDGFLPPPQQIPRGNAADQP